MDCGMAVTKTSRDMVSQIAERYTQILISEEMKMLSDSLRAFATGTTAATTMYDLTPTKMLCF
jgi:hypothetical protein